MSMDTKQCAKCKQDKTVDHYYKQIRNKDNLYSYCKQCHNEYGMYDKDRYSKHTKYNRYGITLDIYNSLLDKQNGLCAICFIDLSKIETNKVHIDHCHDTNVVRGILCAWCNVGLGYFKDNETNLTNAAMYIQRNKQY